ncbi:uncharacterized protein LOC121390961 [Gigantopelta aegis]|uniref:uncharacterized protein LOC121390961 n=1 Tax=Gigantopelta aegis TaxID=1735272 RepID=UPI001B88D6F8|nr:uncharacterized protein LOC121390961 [Gigantopelta aegis]
MDDLRSYKGMEAYNQFVCGWVRDKRVCLRKEHCVVSAKVMHSQRMTAKPLNPWIIAEKGGRVLAAHCDCMAGLGEVCTHVAALLFAIEATIKIRDSKTVTDEKAYWLLPGGVKGVSYQELHNIDYFCKDQEEGA